MAGRVLAGLMLLARASCGASVPATRPTGSAPLLANTTGVRVNFDDATHPDFPYVTAVRLDARTDDNGTRIPVNAAQRDTRFNVETAGKRESVDGCVMTFAYWNPRVLGATRLLNSQTGLLRSSRRCRRTRLAASLSQWNM